MRSDKPPVQSQIHHQVYEAPLPKHGDRQPNAHKISSIGIICIPTAPSNMHPCVSYARCWHDAVATSTFAFTRTYPAENYNYNLFALECHSRRDLMRLASSLLLTSNRIWLRPSATMRTRAVLTLTGTGHFAVLDCIRE